MPDSVLVALECLYIFLRSVGNLQLPWEELDHFFSWKDQCEGLRSIYEVPLVHDFLLLSFCQEVWWSCTLKFEHHSIRYCFHFPPVPFLNVPCFVFTRFLLSLPWSKCRQNWGSWPILQHWQVTSCHRSFVSVHIRSRGKQANSSFSVTQVQLSAYVTDANS